MAKPSDRDSFPIFLAGLVVLAWAGASVLAYTGHLALAMLAGVAGGIVGIPFFGWLVSGPYLEGDLVVTLRRNGGSISREDLSAYVEPGSEEILRRLQRRGVLVTDGHALRLSEKRLGWRLKLFTRLAEEARRPPKASRHH